MDAGAAWDAEAPTEESRDDVASISRHATSALKNGWSHAALSPAPIRPLFMHRSMIPAAARRKNGPHAADTDSIGRTCFAALPSSVAPSKVGCDGGCSNRRSEAAAAKLVRPSKR